MVRGLSNLTCFILILAEKYNRVRGNMAENHNKNVFIMIFLLMAHGIFL